MEFIFIEKTTFYFKKLNKCCIKNIPKTSRKRKFQEFIGLNFKIADCKRIRLTNNNTLPALPLEEKPLEKPLLKFATDPLPEKSLVTIPTEKWLEESIAVAASELQSEVSVESPSLPTVSSPIAYGSLNTDEDWDDSSSYVSTLIIEDSDEEECTSPVVTEKNVHFHPDTEIIYI